MDFKEFIKLDELTRWKKVLAAKERDARRAPFPSQMVKSQAQDYGNIKHWGYGIPGRREGDIEKKIRSMKSAVDPLAQKAPGSVAKMAADRRAASRPLRTSPLTIAPQIQGPRVVPTKADDKPAPTPTPASTPASTSTADDIARAHGQSTSQPQPETPKTQPKPEGPGLGKAGVRARLAVAARRLKSRDVGGAYRGYKSAARTLTSRAMYGRTPKFDPKTGLGVKTRTGRTMNAFGKLVSGVEGMTIRPSIIGRSSAPGAAAASAKAQAHLAAKAAASDDDDSGDTRKRPGQHPAPTGAR